MSDGKIWGGRFKKSTENLMEQFSSSLSFDVKLFDADIAINKAWANALVRINVYTPEEAKTVRETLDDIQSDFHKGKLEFSRFDEDIHSANERWLTERLGDIGARIHTGRSRNDQVVTDLRFYLKDFSIILNNSILELQKSIITLSEKHIETVFPGQTHLRQAQPVSLAHYLLAFFFQLQRDKERLCDAKNRFDKSALGSGAIAGSAFDIDRDAVCNELGFSSPTDNSYDATADRDFVNELNFASSQIMVHLSRIAEDLIIYSSEPFNYFGIDDLYATGSSMMPQKKNPDSLELVRGKSARVIGNLMSGLTLLKGTPTAYVRDLQEDKEPLFDSLEQTNYCLQIFTGVIDTIQVKSDNMLNSLDPALYATDVADYLVKKGVAFRKAHEIVGTLVGTAEEEISTLQDLPLSTFLAISEKFDKDVFDLFDPISALSKRNLYGGTGPESVKKQLILAKDLINS